MGARNLNGAEDNVNSPKHYVNNGVETIDSIKAALGDLGTINYCQGNVMKYISRMWHKKNPLEDAKKAQWYLNRMIQEMENNTGVEDVFG